MYPCKKSKQIKAFAFYSINNIIFAYIIVCILFGTICIQYAFAQGREQISINPPMQQDKLLSSLSKSRNSTKVTYFYPHKILYTHVTYDQVHNKLNKQKRQVVIQEKPKRIIPQAVGITEIIWAICPRDRIIAYHQACTRPEFSFIADQIPELATTFSTEDAEIVIGLNPDLVLITYYTSPEFKERLDSASVKYVETGYFDDISSIKRQIMFLGMLIGEEANARKLVDKMQIYLETIKKYANSRQTGTAPKVIYYDERGYVAGKNTNFNSMCNVLNLENSASNHGIKYFKQVSHEQILKWNPDIIIVPEGSKLAGKLYSLPVLQTARAIKNKNIKKIPSVYLYASSQYIVASLNYLAGILYAK